MRICLIIFALFSTALFADEECSKPEYKCEAIELYQEAKRLNAKGKWKKANKKAQQALAQYDTDGTLNYIKLCLVDNSSAYISKISVTECDANINYYPSKLIAKIKKSQPPKPSLSITYVSKKESWGKATFNSNYLLQPNAIKVVNTGKTALDGIEIVLSAQDGKKIERYISQIKSGESWSDALPEKMLAPFNVEMSEKFGFGFNEK